MKYLRKFPTVADYNAAKKNGNFWYPCVSLTGEYNLYLDKTLSIPNDEIWYTSSDGQQSPHNTEVFGATYLPNESTFDSDTGKGILKFDGNITSIGELAFYGCTGLTSIEIPNSVTNIKDWAFESCSSLTTVTIPNSVTGIGNYAFYDCNGLTSVNIPNSVTSIGSRAFYNCTSLTSPVYNAHVFAYMPNNYSGAYTIPGGIESIAGFAFEWCSGLTSVNIPNSVTSIGNSAFMNCKNLENVTVLSDNINYLGSFIFKGCSKLPYENNCRYADTIFAEVIDKSVTDISIKEGTKYIPESSEIIYNKNIGSLTLPSSLKYIGTGNFTGHYKVDSVYITDLSAWCNIEFKSSTSHPFFSVSSTGGKLYVNGTLLTDLVIPNDVTRVNSYAFYNCKKITNVTLPDSVTHVGTEAFYGINVEQPIYNTHVFAYMPKAKTGSYTIQNGITNIAGGALKGCSRLTSVDIPNTVTSIGSEAFYGCSSLTSVTIPTTNITTICSFTFGSCTGLTSIIVPDNITKIEDEAFYNCASVQNIVLPSTLTYLDESAFILDEAYDYEGSLETITIGTTEYQYDQSQYFDVTLGNGTKVTLQMWLDKQCFLSDTLITLADGSKKQIKDITYEDKLKVWNFDEGHYDTASICWLTKTDLHNNHYYQLTFSDGTILKTTGTHSNHKVYNVDDRFFEGVAYIEVGKRVFTENGIVTLVDKQYIEEDVEYYNLITDTHFNCFANGVLTSDRYGNMYKIDENMMFVKDERPVRPYSEFESANISEYWYKPLRLFEQKDSLDSIRKYIMKLESQMREIE